MNKNYIARSGRKANNTRVLNIKKNNDRAAEQIVEFEREKDVINEKLLRWTRMGLLDIVRLKRERQEIQENLDKLYASLS